MTTPYKGEDKTISNNVVAVDVPKSPADNTVAVQTTTTPVVNIQKSTNTTPVTPIKQTTTPKTDNVAVQTTKPFQPLDQASTILQKTALQNGLPQARIDEAIKSYNTGGLNRQEFDAYLNKWASGTSQTDAVNGQAKTNADGTPIGTNTGVNDPNLPYNIVADTKTSTDALDEYTKTLEGIKGDLGESNAAKMEAINMKYTVEMTNLQQLQQLQTQLTNEQNALVASSTAIQKEEALNAYENNKRAIDLQQKKVKDAYDSMKNAQELANTKAQIKAETAMGLIYGYGSVAQNKNLEDTVVKGVAALQQISKDAINADTELQNKVIEINQSFSLDMRKVEQWKSEEVQKNYASLQEYLMTINEKQDMAEIDKLNAINDAVENYNNKVAEINMTSAQTKYDLSLSLIDKANEYKSLNLDYQSKQLSLESDKLNIEATRKENNLADLDLLMKTYSTSDYADLPDDVKGRMQELSISLNMPDSFAMEAMEIYKKANEEQKIPDFKYYTDNNGAVTAISYNPDTGRFDTYEIGNVDQQTITKDWTTAYNPTTGKDEPFNASTGQFISNSTSGAKGTNADALQVQDGSKGGQCGRFVNDYTGLGLADSYQDKLNKMDKSITIPQAGDVFVMPYSWTGHTGFIMSVDEANGTAVVKDSNWSLNEKVQTHTIKLSSITGYWRSGGNQQETQIANNVNSYIDYAKNYGYEAAIQVIKNEYSNTQERANMLKLFREQAEQEVAEDANNPILSYKPNATTPLVNNAVNILKNSMTNNEKPLTPTTKGTTTSSNSDSDFGDFDSLTL